jgi:hypothetical protein
MMEETIIDNQTSSKKSKIRPNPLHKEINEEDVIPETKLKTSSKKSHHSDHQKENIPENGSPKQTQEPIPSPSKHFTPDEAKEQTQAAEEARIEDVPMTSDEVSLPKEHHSPVKNVVDNFLVDNKTSAVKLKTRSHLKLGSKSRSKSRSKTATKKNKWKEEAEKKEAENIEKEKETEDIRRAEEKHIVSEETKTENAETGEEKNVNVDYSQNNV